MKNLGKTARISFIFVLLVIFIGVFAGLYKNRAAQTDYVYYACFLAVAVASLLGGAIFGLVITMIVIFSYGSFLMLDAYFSGGQFCFTCEHAWWLALFVGISFVIGAAGSKLKNIEKIFREYNQEIDELISTGVLSKLGSIHRFEMDLEYEVARSKRSKSVFQLMYIELSNLKGIEEKFGKTGQPKVMDQIGKEILLLTRDTDKRARTDAKTFAIVLPETPLGNLQVVAKKIINSLQNIKIEHEGKMVQYRPLVRLGSASFPQDGESSFILKEKALKSMKEA